MASRCSSSPVTPLGLARLAARGCFYAYPASVDEVYAEIGERVVCLWGVEERPWGAREFVVTDPDGYTSRSRADSGVAAR